MSSTTLARPARSALLSAPLQRWSPAGHSPITFPPPRPGHFPGLVGRPVTGAEVSPFGQAARKGARHNCKSVRGGGCCSPRLSIPSLAPLPRVGGVTGAAHTGPQPSPRQALGVRP